MASKKVQAALLKQKEAKQKKVLFLLVPVFLGLMAWQGPKTFKAITGGNAPPPTTAAPLTTAPTPGSAPSTPGAGAVVPPSQLVDTDVPPSLMDGQMSNLGVFPGRDPFSGGVDRPEPRRRQHERDRHRDWHDLHHDSHECARRGERCPRGRLDRRYVPRV